MPVRPRRLTLSFLLVLVVVGGLSACDPLSTPNAGVTIREDGSLSIHICKPIESSKVLIEYKPAQKPWITILEGDGNGRYTDIDVSNPPTGLTVTTAASPALAAKGQVSVSLVAVSSQDPGISVTFQVPSEGLPTSKWLTSTGELRDGPCK